MKPFVTILTCVAVAYHFMAGCCGHFAHANSHESAPAVCQHAVCCSHQHDETPASEGEHSDHEQPTDSPSPCGHGECSATLTKAQAPLDHAAVLLTAAPLNDVAGDVMCAQRFDLEHAAVPCGTGRYLMLGRLLN